MTKVVFYKSESDALVGFEASGHAGFADYGRDIVCAAVSALTQACAGGLQEVVRADCDVRMNEDTGYFSCMLSKNMQAETLKDSQILLETLKMALTEISKDYPGTIRIIIRERR